MDWKKEINTENLTWLCQETCKNTRHPAVKNRAETYLTPYVKMNSQRMQDLNVRLWKIKPEGSPGGDSVTTVLATILWREHQSRGDRSTEQTNGPPFKLTDIHATGRQLTPGRADTTTWKTESADYTSREQLLQLNKKSNSKRANDLTRPSLSEICKWASSLETTVTITKETQSQPTVSYGRAVLGRLQQTHRSNKRWGDVRQSPARMNTLELLKTWKTEWPSSHSLQRYSQQPRGRSPSCPRRNG